MLSGAVKCASLLAISCLSLLFVAEQAQAQKARYASEQRRHAAVGYYSRARTMLVEALAEYEQGRRYARPDLLHDTEEFRLKLISLTEQLNRLVDPHARITRDGVRFKANPRMIRRARNQLPEVPDGAQDANDYGEKQRMRELQSARARMYEPKEVEEDEDDIAEVEQVEEVNTLSEREMVEQVVQEAVAEARPNPPSQTEATPENSPEQAGENIQENEVVPNTTEAEPTEEEDIRAGTEMEELNEGAKEPSEDERIATAIETAIQDRLKNLEVGLEEEGEE